MPFRCRWQTGLWITYVNFLVNLRTELTNFLVVQKSGQPYVSSKRVLHMPCMTSHETAVIPVHVGGPHAILVKQASFSSGRRKPFTGCFHLWCRAPGYQSPVFMSRTGWTPDLHSLYLLFSFMTCYDDLYMRTNHVRHFTGVIRYILFYTIVGFGFLPPSEDQTLRIAERNSEDNIFI